MTVSRTPLSAVLPPLILGTATFNVQYNTDPKQMPYTDIIRRALANSVTGFDTSPYYGPSEILLGDALRQLTPPPSRDGYFLVTKVGRIRGDEFDYSPSWIQYSIARSLERLGTKYLDLVYAHDAEFVSPQEVLTAVKELRRLRDQGLVRYVGISGFPVEVLATLAEYIFRETGEPLDAVLSYGHYCVQNSQLGQENLLKRFQSAGVNCVLNASMLGMGLLTTKGVDNLPMASWHPAPPELRIACNNLAKIAASHDQTLEEVSIRWALQNWARVGAPFGTKAGRASRIGVSVMGVSTVEELDETCELWDSIASETPSQQALQARKTTTQMVEQEMWPALGEWKDYAWESGGVSFVNTRTNKGHVPNDEIAQRWGLVSVAMPKI